MAATGKKSKKAKWQKVNVADILVDTTSVATVGNWADAVEEEPETFSNYGSNRPRAPVVLPSASRAARGGMAVDEESIPKRPPYIAYISNLPYDVDESAITDLFSGLKITSLRLPKEGDRLKGYGYVDFEDRESLIGAMNIPDLTISGRRIRIEVSSQDNDRRMGRGRNDRDREYDPERTMGDWRSGPRAVPDTGERSRNMDRDITRNRDREGDPAVDDKPGAWRGGDRPAAEPARTPYGGRDSYNRDRYGDRDRDREERVIDTKPGAWRDGDRPAPEPARTPYGGRDSGREERRSGYGGRDGFRTAERDGFGSRRGFGDRDRDRDPPPREESKPRERPKLNLLPRTVPREAEVPTKPADGAPVDEKASEKPVPKPVPAEKVFGAAKPVDTAAKEREIEERLRKQEEEARKAAEEKDRWTKKSEDSGERRGGARRDERGRDSRSYNRDRRDYSKDDRDRRDFSKEDRGRRDDSKEEGGRRDYSKEDTGRRDYSRDGKDRRDYSKEDKDRRDYSKEHSRDRDRRDSRDRREEGDKRDHSNERQVRTPERDVSKDRVKRDPRNGRSRDRNDGEEKPLPKLKEQEKPNFVASNKFSCLEDDASDGAGSD